MADLAESETWTITDNRIVRFTHKWTITNFDYYMSDFYKNENPEIVSTTFSPIGSETPKFRLKLYPNGKFEEDNGNVTLILWFLKSEHENQQEVRVKCRLSIVDSKKNMNYTQIFTRTSFDLQNGTGYPRYVSHQELQNKTLGLLPDNALTIFCEIEAILSPIKTTGIREVDTPVESQIIGDLAQLFETKKQSDIILVAGKSDKMKYQAHKAILCARSKVFAAMFEHNMEESKKGQIEIDDIEGDVLNELLRFIYTGKVCDLATLAAGLFVAADKYELDALKNQCERYIMHNLTHETVIAMLIEADKHSAPKLRAKAIEYISENHAEIMESESWKSIEEEPKLYFELFSKMMPNNLKRKRGND